MVGALGLPKLLTLSHWIAKRLGTTTNLMWCEYYYYLLNILKSIYLLAYRANLQSMPRFKRIFLVFKINHMNDFRKSLQLTASITKVVVSYHLFCSFGDWRTAKFEFSVVVNLKQVSQFLAIYSACFLI